MLKFVYGVSPYRFINVNNLESVDRFFSYFEATNKDMSCDKLKEYLEIFNDGIRWSPQNKHSLFLIARPILLYVIFGMFSTNFKLKNV